MKPLIAIGLCVVMFATGLMIGFELRPAERYELVRIGSTGGLVAKIDRKSGKTWLLSKGAWKEVHEQEPFDPAKWLAANEFDPSKPFEIVSPAAVSLPAR